MNENKHTKPSASGAANSHDLLTKDELAKRLKLTRRGIECLVARRIIPVIRLSRRCVRFSWEAVQRALAKLEVKEIGR
jgi:excisionase family DNA binding protein